MKEKRNITIIDKKQIPSEEPARQYYFMDIAKKYVAELAEQKGAPLTFCVTTFGCQMNARDSEKLVGILEKIGYVEAPDENRPFTAAVIVLSDKGSRGEREDASGPAAEELLKEAGYDVLERFVIPDEPAVLKHHLIRLADSRQVDLVVTSGGTGFSMRDQTPEATMAVADRNAPGIAEAIRYKSMAVTDRAMLSRGVSVIRKKTLIVNLPRSPKAVKESLGFILDSLDHGLKILRGSASEM